MLVNKNRFTHLFCIRVPLKMIQVPLGLLIPQSDNHWAFSGNKANPIHWIEKGNKAASLSHLCHNPVPYLITAVSHHLNSYSNATSSPSSWASLSISQCNIYTECSNSLISQSHLSTIQHLYSWAQHFSPDTMKHFHSCHNPTYLFNLQRLQFGVIAASSLIKH